jgi:hypothetical protein
VQKRSRNHLAPRHLGREFDRPQGDSFGVRVVMRRVGGEARLHLTTEASEPSILIHELSKFGEAEATAIGLHEDGQ